MDSPPASPGLDLRAIIHIGASSISMLVVEGAPAGEVREIEFLEQPLPLARDVFRHGAVSRATTEHAVQILQGFQESLRELGAGRTHIERAVATNILSEAVNDDVFLNRLSIACGLQIRILDDGEMTRLIYLKTRRRLRETPSMKKRNTLVVHVGPGNTRVLLFQRGRISRYTSYRLGTHRTVEAVESMHVEGAALLRVIREHISGQTSQIYYDFAPDEVEDLIVIGYEIQLLSPFLVTGDSTKATLKSLRSFVAEVAELHEEERVRRYQLDYHTADAVVPALETNLAIAEVFGLNSLRIPESDYERGLLLDLPLAPSFTDEFQGEVVHSATILAGKYNVDPNHAGHVAMLAGRLFEQTRDLHHLTSHDALLLKVSAILHECGGFISPRAHHKHSQYIITHSEIFGLGRLEVQTVALVARYHRQSGPKTSHTAYRQLPGPDRIRVAMLAAILRVADALDRSHSQRIRGLSAEISDNTLRLTLEGVADAAVERLAMQSKGEVFHDVFGLKVILVER